jgi:PGF-CTERM protein
VAGTAVLVAYTILIIVLQRISVMNRRRYLMSLFSTPPGIFILSVSGASAEKDFGEDDDQSDESPNEEGEYVRGKDDVYLTAHVVEDDEDVEYLPEDDEVKFATVMSGDEPAHFETRPWEEWAEMKCIVPAAETAVEYVRREHGVEVTVGDGSVEEYDYALFLEFPDEEFTIEKIAPLTPVSVTVTYVLAGRTYETNIPVFARIQPEVATTGGDAEWVIDEQQDTNIEGGENNESQNGSSDRAESESGGQDSAIGIINEGEGDATEGTESDDDESPNDDPKVDGFGPGFGVGGAIAGICGAGYLLRQQSPEDETGSE